jgi:hypothetical protein
MERNKSFDVRSHGMRSKSKSNPTYKICIFIFLARSHRIGMIACRSYSVNKYPIFNDKNLFTNLCLFNRYLIPRENLEDTHQYVHLSQICPSAFTTGD